MQDILLNPSPQYSMWDIFKRALELKLGHCVNSNLWLQAKPRKSLPWSDADLEKSIQYVKKAEQGILKSW